jgi:phage terminase large subunit GpA-like protein
MNMVQEAIETGKRGVVLMKGGQIGGSDCMINAMLWLKLYLPGPQLFMTSTDDTAREFGRERFRHIIPDYPPLADRRLPGRETDLIHRFVDGKIVLAGGQSVFKLQSTPYRVVVLDELDSLVENLGGEGDPLKLAEIRTDSFTGQTLILAYAHPTTKDRGAAKLFYESSDQRRPMVRHDCGAEWYFQWDHFKRAGDKTDPKAYDYVCPGCGAVVSEEERQMMIRSIVYKSVMPRAEAESKEWIGAQAGQLLSPFKPLESFPARHTACKGRETELQVFFNKVIGESYEPKIKKIEDAEIRRLIAVKRYPDDPEFHSKGQVPPFVQFLTAGQDSRTTQLHYAIIGWGLRRAIDGNAYLCGALIDWSIIDRKYSLSFDEAEYHVFDNLIYDARFKGNVDDEVYDVKQCAHDIGYAPTQIPIVTYCSSKPGRAIPCKGAALDATSACTSPYASWGRAILHKAGDIEVKDESSRALMLNTYMLKTDLADWLSSSNPEEAKDRRIEIADRTLGRRKIARMMFPEDVDDKFLHEIGSEELKRGKRKDELVWTKTRANHFNDCVIQAMGLALNLEPFLNKMTKQERKPPTVRPHSTPRRDGHDPAMG